PNATDVLYGTPAAGYTVEVGRRAQHQPIQCRCQGGTMSSCGYIRDTEVCHGCDSGALGNDCSFSDLQRAADASRAIHIVPDGLPMGADEGDIVHGKPCGCNHLMRGFGKTSAQNEIGAAEVGCGCLAAKEPEDQRAFVRWPFYTHKGQLL